MSKDLRKKIETELSSLIKDALLVYDKVAAAEITKHIRDGVKGIAKKFVKNIPMPPKTKAAKKKVTSSKSKKTTSKKKKPALKKVTSTKKPAPKKTISDKKPE